MCSHCRPFTCSPMFANGAWFSHHTPRGRRKIEVKILRVADLTDLDTFIIHHAFSFPGTVHRRDRVSSRHFLHTFIRFLAPLSSLVTFASHPSPSRGRQNPPLETGAPGWEVILSATSMTLTSLCGIPLATASTSPVTI